MPHREILYKKIWITINQRNFIFSGLCEVCSVKLNYTRRSKSHKKEDHDGDSDTGKHDESKDSAASSRNPSDEVESKKDSETDLWKNQHFQEIEINFDNKIDAYLHDLF